MLFFKLSEKINDLLAYCHFGDKGSQMANIAVTLFLNGALIRTEMVVRNK